MVRCNYATFLSHGASTLLGVISAVTWLRRSHGPSQVSLRTDSQREGVGSSPPHQRFTPSPHALYGALDQNSSQAYALNMLDGHTYLHHPVMLAIPAHAFRLRGGWLVEPGGLKVPVGYDCVKNGSGPWGGQQFPYWYQVPSRRWHCCFHHAMLQARFSTIVPPLPVIDDEYYEHVAVFQSVLRLRKDFFMVEMGARWGTWGSRAAALHRFLNPGKQHHVLFYEINRDFCDGISVVVDTNNLHADRHCSPANATSFLSWADQKDHIDLIDMDIQAYEGVLVPQIKKTLDEKVFRLIIGTHSLAIHKRLKALLKNDWTLLHEMEPTRDPHCVKENFWSYKNMFQAILKNPKCYSQTLAHGRFASGFPHT